MPPDALTTIDVSGCRIRYLRSGAGRPMVLFTAMLWPGIGGVVARSGTRGLLRRVLEGGFHEPGRLPGEFVDELHRSGSRPGHARAFRSLCSNWRSWIAARRRYGAIRVPVTLVYSRHDWSRPDERDANARDIPGASSTVVDGCGHFSCLERPDRIAAMLKEGGAPCPGPV